MSHPFTAPPGQEGLVRTLLAAIALMTLAIAFMIGMFAGRLTAPRAAAPPARGLDFAAAPVVAVGFPAGARAVAAHVAAGRVTFEIETVHGEKSVYTAPLEGLSGPVRIVYQTAERAP